MPDRRDRLVAERIAASPAGQPLVRRIGGALVEAAASMTGGDGTGDDPATGRQFLLARVRLMIATPALRAKHLDSNYALQQTIVDALGEDTGDSFHAHAATSACLAAMHTALARWAEDDGSTDLPDLIAEALAAAFGDDVVASGRGG